ncbi:hypothetical protein [Streptomyces sp. NPDC003006]
MIKKAITCAAIVAAAMTVGTSSASADDRGMENDKRPYAAVWGGGKFDVVKSSSGAGIFSGEGHYGGFRGSNR